MTSTLIESHDRLRAVFARIDSGDEGADVAFQIASKALTKAGLTWTNLLEAYLAQTPGAKDGSQGNLQSFENAFQGIFNGFNFSRPSRPSSPPPMKPVHNHVREADIPSHVSGKIVVLQRRETQRGEMVVVQVEKSDGQISVSYGPLVIFNKRDIERLDASPSKVFFGQVTQPQNKRFSPILSHLRD